MNIYTPLKTIFPTRQPPISPRRILLVRPCCIGDVVLATAALTALRRAYPKAHITWAVGGWSREAVEMHPMLDDILDTGPAAMPVRSPADMRRFAAQVHAGNYDLAVSLVRSPLMSMALYLARVPHRAGIDSGGRGFAYTVRAPADPIIPRHEAEIYLDVVRALGVDTDGIYANIPVRDDDREAVRGLAIKRPYVVIHPGGGSNPGMRMDAKRWPPANFAALANRLASRLNAGVVLVSGPHDRPIVAQVQSALMVRASAYAGTLTFGQIAALAAESLVYIGNDTGLTHLAAAAGARTAMIFGPSDPLRYAPFTPDSLSLWKRVPLRTGGVAAGMPDHWDWARDGISVDAAAEQLLSFMSRRRVVR